MEFKIVPNPANRGQCCTFKKGDKYYWADKSWVSDAYCFETMIFPSDADGNVTDWGEVYCDRTDKSLVACIQEFLAS